ncbi:hypothetical protein E2C01_085090 [Portunus trituberculatus]|uniref:Uncharacterized protein n=1 Tax=Portunus trituberculatus TaxID=210409 RepID=A0A5B7J018_PORTR|nr:hypothetical protein [Portunus trituberculatus]
MRSEGQSGKDVRIPYQLPPLPTTHPQHALTLHHLAHLTTPTPTPTHTNTPDSLTLHHLAHLTTPTPTHTNPHHALILHRLANLTTPTLALPPDNHQTNPHKASPRPYLASLGNVHGADDVVDEDSEEQTRDDLDKHTVEPEVDPLQQTIVRLGPLAEVHVVQGRVVVPAVWREG